MDYFQGVVSEYLRANRSTFVNPEFFLTLEHYEGGEPPRDTSWYVDLLAVSFEDRAAYLCEVTYSRTPYPLIKRLSAWKAKWSELQQAVRRDAHLPSEWTIRPWIFVPESGIKYVLSKGDAFPATPKITPLEMTLPWKYCTYNREIEAQKPSVPKEMA